MIKTMRPTTGRFPARVALVALAGLLVLVSPALAGKAETGEPAGSTPMPNTGKEVEISFNPTVRVTAAAGETIQSLFQRLADAAQDASVDFVVDANVGATPPFGVEILRAGGEELDQLSFRENDPALQVNAVTVNFPGLIAKIRRMRESPQGGQIIVRLNETVIPVPTTPSQDGPVVDQELLGAIRNAGFQAFLGPEYLIVERDRNNDQSLTTVALNIQDPGIESSEIGLELPGAGSEEAIPTLSEYGMALMMTMLLLAGLAVLRRRGLAARRIR
jgi:hypothetical protein